MLPTGPPSSDHGAASFSITGVTLHTYRYAWTERAKQCGCPERFAQEALGHNGKAIHRAYARKVQVVLPPLEEYEKKAQRKKILPFPVTQGSSKRAMKG